MFFLCGGSLFAVAYVQEGTGHDYENAVHNRRLWAEIALDGRGTPARKRLVIE
jgi:uncharacterized membrane-anchored protein